MSTDDHIKVRIVPDVSGFLAIERAFSDFLQAMRTVASVADRTSLRLAALTVSSLPPKRMTRAQRKANPRRSKAGRQAAKSYETYVRHALAGRFPTGGERRKAVHLATGRHAARGQR